jgi:hypothetical protein
MSSENVEIIRRLSEGIERGDMGLERGACCVRCALRYRPMLRRSLWTALVVGTILVAISQGTVIGKDDFPAELAWKVPLTYLVPFCVASWGTLINSRVDSKSQST